ncbi:MAG TPA: hypothetical protein VKB38_08350 [Terracidiphilus sp.]|nr:hypothetical protein [Terracidiphilus sp.]
MKRWGCVCALLLLAAAAWGAARKLTVQQLKDLLASEKQANMTDGQTAEVLENVELTERLSRSTMDSMARDVPGQMTTEQLFVLEARSATLPPPAADIPADPAPDAATQNAILAKAMDYITKTYAQLPPLTATKETRRFQDSSQISQEAFASKNSASFAPKATPIHYTAADENTVMFHGGAEQASAPTQKTTWGQNGMIVLLGQAPNLNTVLQEAQGSEKIGWARWENVDGKKMAVFSFAVDKKKSRYGVNYCCFPDVGQAGPMQMRGTASGGEGGNYQSVDQWKPWKAVVPYRGEIFVDPDTGVVTRLAVQGEFKGSDPVRLENQRIDFGEVKVGDKTFTVPVRTLIDTLEQPYPDLPSGRFIFRHTLFTSDYKDYKAG